MHHLLILSLLVRLLSQTPSVFPDASSGLSGGEIDTGRSPLKTYVLADSVQVSAERIRLPLAELATSATMLSGRQLRQGPASSVPAALRGVPGLHTYDLSGTGTQGIVDSRGFASMGETSYLMVMIDDLPVNDLESGNVNWNLLSLSQVERIELLRGPASYLYGNSSMAGLVNVVTREPEEGLHAWGDVAAGSCERLSTALGLQGGGASAAMSLSGRFQDLAGYRDHSAGEISTVYGQGRFRPSPRWRIRSQCILARSNQEIPGPLPDSLWRSEPKKAAWDLLRPIDHKRERVLAPSLELRWAPSPDLETVALVRGDLRDFRATETVIPMGPLDHQTESQVVQAEFSLRGSSTGRSIRNWLLGGQVESGRLHSRYYEYQGDARISGARVDQDQVGLFAFVRSSQLTLRPLPGSFILSGGLRLDRSSSQADPLSTSIGRAGKARMSDLSPALGANYELPGLGHLFASAAGSFKAPTLRQLYDQRPYTLSPADPPMFLSSSDLGPQHGVHYEIGFRSGSPSRLDVEGEVFYAKSRDEIGFVNDFSDPAQPRFGFANIERSLHWGFDGSLGGEIFHRVSGDLGYTYTRAEFEGGTDDGKQINNVPKHQLSARLDWENPWRGILTAEAQYVRHNWLDEANRIEIPAFSTLGLSLVQGVGPLQLFAGIENLLDEHFASMGYVTIDQQGDPLPLYYPGAGRSFRVGLRRTGP